MAPYESAFVAEQVKIVTEMTSKKGIISKTWFAQKLADLLACHKQDTQKLTDMIKQSSSAHGSGSGSGNNESENESALNGLLHDLGNELEESRFISFHDQSDDQDDSSNESARDHLKSDHMKDLERRIKRSRHSSARMDLFAILIRQMSITSANQRRQNRRRKHNQLDHSSAHRHRVARRIRIRRIEPRGISSRSEITWIHFSFIFFIFMDRFSGQSTSICASSAHTMDNATEFLCATSDLSCERTVSESKSVVNHISVFCANFRSINNKIDLLKSYCEAHQYSAIIACETSLTDKLADNMIIPDHQIFRNDRDSRGGGVMITVKTAGAP